jgi:hypothetical protein
VEDVTLSLSALVVFVGVIAQAIAAREGIKRNRERHEARDGIDLRIESRLSALEQWQRDRDTEARVRKEIHHDHTPIEAIPTKEFRR